MNLTHSGSGSSRAMKHPLGKMWNMKMNEWMNVCELNLKFNSSSEINQRYRVVLCWRHHVLSLLNWFIFLFPQQSEWKLTSQRLFHAAQTSSSRVIMDCMWRGLDLKDTCVWGLLSPQAPDINYCNGNVRKRTEGENDWSMRAPQAALNTPFTAASLAYY